MVFELRYPSMNNVLAKKENANTTMLTWSNNCLRGGLQRQSAAAP
jgi:hypothetical protein